MPPLSRPARDARSRAPKRPALGARSRASVALGSLVVALSLACSSSEPETILPYPVGQAMVFGSPQGGVLTRLDASCASEACAAARERCGEGAYAEVIVNGSGALLDVLCYPGELAVRHLQEGPFDRIRDESDTVFVFDAHDDGADLLGDVAVSGDDVVLYGAGAEVSVLGAGLRIDGQRVLVRGVTVRGDVTIDKHDVKLSLVQIDGDLTINGNRVTLSESIVYGDIHLVGSGAVFSRNLLQGAERLRGSEISCHENQRFDDADGERDVDGDELGAEIPCR